MSIALATMAAPLIAGAEAAGIPLEMLRRTTSIASSGVDTLPHNGAVITRLAVTGLTRKDAYSDIFFVTWIKIKTAAVFVAITVFFTPGVD